MEVTVDAAATATANDFRCNACLQEKRQLYLKKLATIDVPEFPFGSVKQPIHDLLPDVIPQLIGEWYEDWCREQLLLLNESTKSTTTPTPTPTTSLTASGNVCPIIPWAGITLVRVPEDSQQANHFLYRTPLREWVHMCGQRDALLLYRFVPLKNNNNNNNNTDEAVVLDPQKGRIVYTLHILLLVEKHSLELHARQNAEARFCCCAKLVSKEAPMARYPKQIYARHRFAPAGKYEAYLNIDLIKDYSITYGRDVVSANGFDVPLLLYEAAEMDVDEPSAAAAAAAAAATTTTTTTAAGACCTNANNNDNNDDDDDTNDLYAEIEMNRNHVAKAEKYNQFLQLTARLLASTSSSSQTFAETVDAAVTQQYLPLICDPSRRKSTATLEPLAKIGVFCRASARVLDAAFRRGLIHYYFSVSDETERKRLERVLAAMLQCLIRNCWPYEQQIKQLVANIGIPMVTVPQELVDSAIRAHQLNPDDSLKVLRKFTTESEASSSSAAATVSSSVQKQKSAAVSTPPMICILRPGQNIDSLARIYNAICPRRRGRTTFKFDNGGSGDNSSSSSNNNNGSSSSVNPTACLVFETISGRFEKGPESHVIGGTATGTWYVYSTSQLLLQSPGDVCKPCMQVLWSDFPTRLFFISEDNSGGDTNAEKNNIEKWQKIAASIDPSLSSYPEWTSYHKRIAVSVSDRNEYIVVFPLVVFPTLNTMIQCLREHRRPYHCHGSVVSLELTEDTTLQPSLEQLQLSVLAARHLTTSAAALSSSSSFFASESSDPSLPTAVSTTTTTTTTTKKTFERQYKVFDAEQMRCAVRATLAQFKEKHPGYLPPPTTFWICSDSDFSFDKASSPTDPPPTHLIALRSKDEIVRFGGRVVTYADMGQWIAHAFISCLRREYSNIAAYGGDLQRFLVERFGIQDYSSYQTCVKHIDRILVGERVVVPSPHVVVMAKQVATRVPSAETAATATTAAAAVVPALTMEEIVSQKKHIETPHPQSQQQPPPDFHKLQVLLKDLTAPYPGSNRERDEWMRFADAHGEEFAVYLYTHHDARQQPNKSIHTTPIMHYNKPTFLWNEYNCNGLGGMGAWSLTVMQLALKSEIGFQALDLIQWKDSLRANSAPAAAAQEEPTEDSISTTHDAAQSPPPPPQQRRPSAKGWVKLMAQNINDRIIEKHGGVQKMAETMPRKSLKLTNNYVYEVLRGFYQEHCSQLGDASSAAAAAVPTDTILEPVPAKLAKTLEQSRQQVQKVYSELSAAFPSDGLYAQYVRETRRLDRLPSAVLERSPYVRVQERRPYGTKIPKEQLGGRKKDKQTNYYPAIVIFAIGARDGQIEAEHGIFLDPISKNKVLHENARLNAAKKSQGELRDTGSFGLLQPGFVDAFPFVFLAEGPETGWSIAECSPALCVFVAFGVSRFAAFRFFAKAKQQPTLCLVLDREVKKSSDEEREAADAARGQDICKLKQAGWRSVVAIQPDCADACCKDFNDVRQNHGLGTVQRMLRLPVQFTSLQWPAEYEQWRWKCTIAGYAPDVTLPK